MLPKVDREVSVMNPVLQQRLRANWIARSLGYRVVQVPSTAHEFKGGIHCLVNVIE